MRICFVSRRFFPAISGMSIYAINLLRQLVAGGRLDATYQITVPVGLAAKAGATAQ